jgi:hypothetical protein
MKKYLMGINVLANFHNAVTTNFRGHDPDQFAASMIPVQQKQTPLIPSDTVVGTSALVD